MLPFVACNDKDDKDDEPQTVYGSTLVRSFSLNDNKNILANLDTIYFSIDQVNASIFNADSLPYGTRVDKLTVNLTVDGCSVVELRVPTATGTNTINYLANTTDSIDFSRGPVTLHLVSLDGSQARDYQIKVNVHKTYPERFAWTSVWSGRYPTSLTAVTSQRTVARGDKAYCLSTDDTHYCIAVSDSPELDRWEYSPVAFGFVPDVRSFTAASDAFYILAADGTLYRSADLVNWQSTGQTWTYIYGAYVDRLVGVARDTNGYHHVSWPASGVTVRVADDMPVSGTSAATLFTTKWSSRPQMLVRGGRTASGKLTGDLYGYDGTSWVDITRSEARVSGVENPALFPYFVARVDSLSWRVTEQSVLMSTFGTDEQGRCDSHMYVSYDMGISWETAPGYLQLPGSVPDYVNPDAIVLDVTRRAESRSALSSFWGPVQCGPLPAGWCLDNTTSRATRPVDEWNCPTVYLSGCRTEGHTNRPAIFRGILNQLTYKPLQ